MTGGKHDISIFRAMVMVLGMLAVGWAHAADNTLQSVRVTPGNNDSLVVKIAFSDAVAGEPVHFSTSNPHRVVVDFPHSKSAAGRLEETLNQGVIAAYNVVQAGDRTRLVLNLSGPADYQVRSAGSQVLVVLRGALAEAQVPSPASFAEIGPKQAHALRDVKFQRGKAGEGRIVVDLSDPGLGIDIRQKGPKLQVDFLNTAVPEKLQRRLDVIDFATPVQFIETLDQGRNARMTVDAQGKWDYSAYQAGDQFIVEIRALEDAQQSMADKPRYSGEKLTLNFQNVGVREVLQVIADFTGLNIIASDTVSGNLTLRLKEVPWDQALDIILRAKGLDKRTTGNVIWVAPRDELAAKEKLELEARQQITDLEDLQTEAIRLNYLRADEAQAILNGQSLASSGAREAVTCSTGATGVGGAAAVAAAAGAAGGAQRILSKRGTTSYDLKSNTLFVQDSFSKLQEIKEMLKRVDQPSRQVMIEARVVVADDSFSRKLGTRLGYKFGGHVGGVNVGTSGNVTDSAGNAANGQVGGGDNLNVDLGVGAAPSIGFTLLGASQGALLNIELQALEADNRGTVISNPRIITTNQKPAVILNGEQIPFTTAGSANSPPTVSFKDAFLCLLVDPQVLNNDTVILTVEVQQDAKGDTITTAAGDQFAINTRRIKTQVRVNNGETVVLGGIFEQVKRKDVQKVPLLGDVPILGYLFRNKSEEDNKSELLIFLTPRVLAETAL